MERYLNLQEATDGKLYSVKDEVLIGCNDCEGCHLCCTGMGKSIVLDPYDIFQLKKGLGIGFEGLMKDKIELSVVDGLVLPNLALSGEEEKCGFLNKEGRCSIHNIRPGICRLFPLGRIYNEKREFDYIFQVNECPKRDKTPVKIEKWLDMTSLKKYEKFISEWHFFLKDLSKLLEDSTEDIRKNAGIVILKWFYMDFPAGISDFYSEFYLRLNKIKNVFEIGE